MKVIKHVPNALSVIRIILSVSLLFFAKDHVVLFCIAYLLAGISDVLDGKIARYYHVESKIGSMLDAVGDSLLFGTALISMVFFADLDINVLHVMIAISFGVIYKIANVFVTRVRFKQFNMMHTLMNKSVFVTLYFYVPIFFVIEEVNLYMMAAISLLICLACFEETLTLMRMKEYDVNCYGIWGEKLAKKLSRKKAA